MHEKLFAGGACAETHSLNLKEICSTSSNGLNPCKIEMVRWWETADAKETYNKQVTRAFTTSLAQPE